MRLEALRMYPHCENPNQGLIKLDKLFVGPIASNSITQASATSKPTDQGLFSVLAITSQVIYLEEKL